MLWAFASALTGIRPREEYVVSAACPRDPLFEQGGSDGAALVIVYYNKDGSLSSSVVGRYDPLPYLPGVQVREDPNNQ